VERKDEAARVRREGEERLYRFSPGEARAVTVEAGGETTRFVRAGGGWRAEAPGQATPATEAIDALLERVSGLRRKATLSAAPDAGALASHGLARPRARVTVALGEGRAETLELGDENPFDGTVFVHTTAGAIELVGGDVRWTIERVLRAARPGQPDPRPAPTGGSGSGN
jgi:hypothetical protein